MTYGLDTSIVLRIMTGEPEELALQAGHRVAALVESGETLVVSDLVVAETYYALQFHYKMTKDDALAALILIGKDGSGIRFVGTTGKILQTPRLAHANPGFVDRLIHAGYRQAGYALLTCETAANKLDGVEVVGG
jgi:predicted nucleic acid-binding protein